MPTPTFGRRFTKDQQPASRGVPSQPAAYVSPEERERRKIEADVEAREQALDDAADYQPVHIALSTEEIAKEEAERAQLAADLKASRPSKPGPERSAPESLSSHPIVDISEVAPSREVEVVESRRLDVLESAEAELRALAEDESASLDAELRAFEEKSAIEMSRIREAGEAKRAEIRARQDEQRALIAKERAAARPAELAQKAKTATREAEANRTRESAPLVAQRAEFAQSWAPLLQAAKETVAAVTRIDRKEGIAIRELAALAAFIDTPSTWPLELRQKMGKDCIMPSREVMRLLDNYRLEPGQRMDSPRDVVAQAERMLATWRPGEPVANLRQMLSYINADTVRYITAECQQILDRFEVIEAQGKAYVATGAVPPEVTINPATEQIRREAKEDHIFRGLTNPRDTHATGMGDTNLPR
jgi:hypothetical protein